MFRTSASIVSRVSTSTTARFLSSTAAEGSKLKLYGFGLSQPTRSVIFLCDENKIPFDLVHFDARKGDTRKPEFRKLFPAGLVPALLDESVKLPGEESGFKVEESVAILTYICDKHQLEAWYPSKDIYKKAKVNFWLNWHHANTRKSTKSVLVTRFFPPKNIPLEDALTAGRNEYSRCLRFLESSLATLHQNNQRFLCAGHDHPTIADLLILPELDQLSAAGFALFDYTSFPHISKYMETMKHALPTYEKNFTPVAKEAERYRPKSQA